MNPLPKVSFPLAVAAIIVLSSCSTSDSTSPADAAPRVEAVTQKAMSGIVGGAANPVPVIRVTDPRTHKPLADVTVEFRLGQSGSLKAPTVTTDASGLASPGEWVFSTRAGLNQLNVYVNHTFQFVFSATTEPDAPAELRAITGDQAALPGGSVFGPYVQVVDRFQNGVPNVIVSFAISAGDGTLQHNSAKTQIDGYAYAGSWTLGAAPGSNQATASVPGIAPIVSNAEVLDPANIKWYNLENVGIGSQQLTPSQFGIAYSRIGLTAFDPCLCKRQVGYFLEELLYTISGAELLTSSGRYVLEGKVLTLGESNGAIDGKSLFLDQVDFDFGTVSTWVYREVDVK